jgi:hypothetical protein
MRRGKDKLEPVISNTGSLTSAPTNSDSSSGNSDGTSSDSESDSAKEAKALQNAKPEFKTWYKKLTKLQQGVFLGLNKNYQEQFQSTKITDKVRTNWIVKASKGAADAAKDVMVCYAQIILFQEQPTNNTQRTMSRRPITQMKIP